jgi:hypothetical protein
VEELERVARGEAIGELEDAAGASGGATDLKGACEGLRSSGGVLVLAVWVVRFAKMVDRKGGRARAAARSARWLTLTRADSLPVPVPLRPSAAAPLTLPFDHAELRGACVEAGRSS